LQLAKRFAESINAISFEDLSIKSWDEYNWFLQFGVDGVWAAHTLIYSVAKKALKRLF
jgi:hypothetical protein